MMLRMSTTDPTRLLTSTEAAAYLRVSRNTVHRLVRDGKLPGAVQIGRQWRFSPAVLEDWMRSRAEGSTAG